jgi:hypothetical protein
MASLVLIFASWFFYWTESEVWVILTANRKFTKKSSRGHLHLLSELVQQVSSTRAMTSTSQERAMQVNGQTAPFLPTKKSQDWMSPQQKDTAFRLSLTISRVSTYTRNKSYLATVHYSVVKKGILKYNLRSILTQGFHNRTIAFLLGPEATWWELLFCSKNASNIVELE